MKIEVIKEEPRFIVVRLTGSLDMTTVGDVEQQFLSTVSASHKNVIVELGSVDFLASMGLSMFLSASKSLQRDGLRLVLTNPKPLIREALRASRLSSMLLIVQNEDEALKMFLVPEGA